MQKKILLGVIASTLVTNSFAQEEVRERVHSVKKAIASVQKTPQKELDIVHGFNHMFEDAKASGQVLSIYSGLNYDDSEDIYATAIGGFLKYELAEFQGFSAATAFIFSQDVSSLSGNADKNNNELSSSEKSYTQMSEAYINYEYDGLSLRGGRQIIDTPLADSDDIRMVANSFEAYIATYKYESVSFMSGALLSWQGYDAGLDDAWTKTGEDNTYFAGLSWSDEFIDASIWYYNINGVEGDATANNSYYGDLVGHMQLSKKFFLHTGVQYLKQDELDKSGVASEIYGAMAELVAYGVGLNIAYNKSLKQDNKQSFSGFGGGALFTSMDNMIVDVIAVDRDVDALVTGLSYEYKDFNFLYAYGDFAGGSDETGQKEHIVEQNIAVTYEHKDITFGAIVTIQEDKENTGINDGDWNNVRVLASYNF